MHERWGALLAVVLWVLACAPAHPPLHRSYPEVRERERMPPLSPPSADLAPRLLSQPDASTRSPGLRLLEEQRFTVNIQDADLAATLLGLGRESPLNVVVEPGVEGRVTADLKDATLLQILDQIVRPRGYHWAVEGNLLRVFRSDRETRTYRIDYPNYTRDGLTEFQIGGSIVASTGIASEEEEDDGDEEISRARVQTAGQTDLWTEIERAIETMVFGAPSGEDAATSAGLASADAGGIGEELGLPAAADEASTAPAPVDVAAPSPTSPAGGVLPPRRVIVSRNSGLVTVSAETVVLEEVERYLLAVARATDRQVLIDARILEITLTDGFDWGIDVEYAPSHGGSTTVGALSRMFPAGGPAATVVQNLAPTFSTDTGSFSFGVASDNLSVVLRALAAQTDLRVVSTPRLTTLNNHKAIIKVVRNEVFFIAETEADVVEGVGRVVTIEFEPQIIPVGVTLDVTPQISDGSQITMHIHPSVSEIVNVVEQPQGDPDLANAPTGSLPVVDLRETDTVLRVDDGETIVIGGLIQSREFDMEEKTPLLAEVPILGQLFRGTHKEEKRTELVILLTPTVLDRPRVVRVTRETEADLAELERLHDHRSHEPPWWRRPLLQGYRVP